MADSAPGPRTERLIGLLDALVGGLRGAGQDHWAGWMAVAARRLRAGEFAGIEKVLGAYGGMGSFSDLMLPEPLDRLREEVAGLANEIRRDAEFG